MKTIPIDKEIMAQVRQLPYRYRQQVLAFIRALRMSRPKGTPGSELLKFAGAIERELISK